MTLDPRTHFPPNRGYVLKLHRDAGLAGTPLQGRLEHITSGQRFDFQTGDELLVFLAGHLQQLAPEELPDPLPERSD